MRPAGDVRQALLAAARDLTTAARSPTLREIATHAKVGYSAARRTLDNMKRAGDVVVPRQRRVAYVNRPVDEYAPAPAEAPPAEGVVELTALLAAWGR